MVFWHAQKPCVVVGRRKMFSVSTLVVFDIFHKINHFLGTYSGHLFKRVLELLFLIFACYMVASEWLRTKADDLKYLLIGFGSLAMQKLLSSAFFAHVVFAGTAIAPYINYIHAAENFLEIGALILISSAFLYPVHKKHGISLRKITYVEIGVMLTIYVFAALVFFEIIPLPFGTRRRFILALMNLTKFAILLFPVIMFWKKSELTDYNKAVAIAFVIYSVAPFFDVLNWSFYDGDNANLLVLAHPFPFIAVIQFTRVIFLKLVDKATLKGELLVTRRKYVRAVEINRLKDEFVSTVSHELRTPVTSLRLNLHLLLTEKFGKLQEKQKDVVSMLEKESVRLGKLIDDILSLSRYQKRKEKLSLKAISLRELVQSCIYPHQLEGKNVAVMNTIPDDMMIAVDADKFKQVFINLFNNAAKYTDNGTIRFTAAVENNSVRITVADTGSGIPAEQLQYIFDKFYQAEGHMTRQTGGVGLGLAIVKNIVELHNGQISVASELGKGTTFTIVLPL